MAPAPLQGAFIYMAPAPLQGAFIYMAPASLQGALASPCARQLSMDTRPSVCHPTSKMINFLKDVAFPKKRGVLSSRHSR